VNIELPDEAATLACAARLARHLPRGPQPLVLYLQGDLGAGKTTLARGMLHALGEQGAVRSPTYSLLAEYEPPAGRVLHLDLYRLSGPEELAALALPDLLPGSILWLVEWPDRARGRGLPPADTLVFLDLAGTGRRLRLDARTAEGKHWLTAVNADAG
jgi:tRNA threonylcarbamoyladenosine biosynthesis protein TsaE